MRLTIGAVEELKRLIHRGYDIKIDGVLYNAPDRLNPFKRLESDNDTN